MLSEKNKLVGCSFNQNFVGLWVVDLKDVRPFGSGGGASDLRSSEPYSRSDLPVSRSDTSLPGVAGDRGSGYNRDRSNSASASTGAAPARGPSPGALLQPGNLQRGGSEQLAARGGVAGAAGGALPGVRSQSRGRVDVRGVGGGGGSQDVPISVAVPPLARHNSAGTSGNGLGSGAGAPRYPSGGAADSVDPDVRVHVPSRPPPPPGGLGAAAAAGASGRGHMVSVGVGVGDSLMRGQVEPGQLYAMAQGAAAAVGQRLDGGASPPHAGRRPGSTGSGAQREEPSGAAGGRAVSDADLLSAVTGRHDAVKGALAFRLSNLQMCRNFMQRGDMRGALSVVKRCGDASVGADLLSGILGRRDSACTLDLVPDVVPVIEKVLGLPSEKQIQVCDRQAGDNPSSFMVCWG